MKMRNSPQEEFPLWLSNNETDLYAQGHRFKSWPCSVGQGTCMTMMYCVGQRCSLDPMLLWLWQELETIAPIQPLAWEIPGTMDAVLRRQK